ncbi:MAG TPA: pseudaminic acid synthase [Acetivibrio sp.]|uniref:pseudaminic acid synthase n=1 Tax=Acetivibrio sp. TaxID=1872092 RepID=UPI002BCC7DDB|nr:pseudaminic acid synthase [Acetivibrio sp.]HOM01299.1 pseudaminic acid synthase [Acetivibrio sp.]
MGSVILDGNDLLKSGKVYIVAEMSANHLQDMDRAKRIISAAKEAGADAIKIQTYRPDTITIDCYGEEFLCTPGSPWEGMNLFELYKTAYTPWEWHQELFDYAKEIGISMFSSPFDLSSVDFLRQFNMPAYKIASYEINDIPLIKKVASEGKPIIISTGLANLGDIEMAIETCKAAGNDQIILLKCVSEYPTPYEDINLKTMVNMKETFGCVVGLSDHSLGSCVSVAAVALGAKVIEKHLTLSRKDGGADSNFSMEPDEFGKMVQDIRNVEKSLGTVTYELTDRQKMSKKRSRSLYIVKDVAAGETLTPENVKSIRPGYGLHTRYYEEILGKRVNRDLKKGTALQWKFID